MSASVGYATLNIIPSAKGFGAALRGEINPALGPVGNDAGKKTGSGIIGGLKSMIGPAMLATGALAMGQFLSGAISSASNLQQATGAIDAIFKSSAPVMAEFGASAAKHFGLAKTEVAELSAVLGAQLKNAGVSMDQLAPQTQNLVGLGADLAAMFGGTTREAVEAISSALKGERDPIERYGVSLSQARIDAEAAALGFDKVGGSLSSEANAAATMSLLMKQTADAHGAAARESDTFAARQQQLAAGWENMKAAIGTAFLPAAAAAVGILADLINGAGPLVQSIGPGLSATFSALGPAFSQLGTALAQLIPNLSPLGLAFQTLAPVLPQISQLLSQVATVLAETLTIVAMALQPVLEALTTHLSGVLAAVLPVIANLLRQLAPVIGQAAAAVGGLVASLAPLIGAILGSLIPVIQSLLPVIEGVFGVIVAVVTVALDFVSGIIAAVTLAISGDWGAAWGAISSAFEGVWNAITAFLAPVIEGVAASIGDTVDGISQVWNASWTAISGFFSDIWDGIVSALKPVVAFISSLIQTHIDIWTGIFLIFAAVLKVIWDGIVSVVKTVWNAIVAFLTPTINAISSFIKDTFEKVRRGWEVVWAAVSTVFTSIWNGIVSFLTPIINGVRTTITNVVNGIRSTWENIWNGIVSFFTNAWNNIVSSVTNKVREVGNVIGGIRDKVMGAIAGIGDWLLSAGGDLIRGLWNGISNVGNWLRSKITGFFDGAVGWAKDILGIHSPSRRFAELGVFVGQGFGDGIDSMASSVAASARGLGQAAIDAVDGMPDLAIGAHLNGTSRVSHAIETGDGGAVGRRLAALGTGNSQTLNYTQNAGQGLTSEQELIVAARRLQHAY
ncbi:hypothetical protein AB0N61_00380 [Microbacterium sp. NPDC089320]|uniref:phage tail protein n=1 Tax=Microbacterium sp. NPDC089320 TaxID=3155182 RepID=UPI00343D5D59